MLEKNDPELIRDVVQEVVGDALEQIVLPRFGEIDKEIGGIKGELMEIRSTMATKDFLEDRLADFKATLKQSGRQALRQVKLMAGELHRNGGLTAKQVVQVTTA